MQQPSYIESQQLSGKALPLAAADPWQGADYARLSIEANPNEFSTGKYSTGVECIGIKW